MFIKKSVLKTHRYFFPLKRNFFENKVLIGTHHKTGTSWFRKIFENISLYSGLKFFAGEQKDLPGEFDIFFQNHSKFDLQKIIQDYRGVHNLPQLL